MYDCLIIGGGIIGCSLLRELSKYDLSCCLVEAEDDIATGATRANSGINHAGFDCTPNTLKAKHNVVGNALNQKLCEELNVPYLNCGSLVLADKNGFEKLKKLQLQGKENNVETEILTRDNLLKIESNVADNIEYALFAPSAGVMSPYKLCIAEAEQALENGAKIFLNCKVEKVKPIEQVKNAEQVVKEENYFEVITKEKTLTAKIVVNCTGSGCNKVNEMAGAENLNLIFRRGEYFLLDKTERKNINTILFPLPDENGKGILIAPTADGNVILGPTAINQEDDSAIVTKEGLDFIRLKICESFKKANFKKTIRLYSGIRSIVNDDFVIGFSKKVENFYLICGICSPGLSASSSIAVDVACEIAAKLKIKKKLIFKPFKFKKHFYQMSYDEMQKAIESDNNYGNIVCRCEKVTEAEIIETLNSPLKIRTIDGIKRRTRAGMGRCQGGFCEVKIMEIISKETGLKMTDIKKGGDNSYIAVSEIKDGEYEL